MFSEKKCWTIFLKRATQSLKHGPLLDEDFDTTTDRFKVKSIFCHRNHPGNYILFTSAGFEVLIKLVQIHNSTFIPTLGLVQFSLFSPNRSQIPTLILNLLFFELVY